MPTKTKPKRPADGYMIPVKIREADRRVISECLGVDHKKEATQLDEAIGTITMSLTASYNMLRRVTERPLPAHIVADLKPIEKAAKELAALIDPGELPPAVLRELGVWEVADGEAWRLLTNIQVSASLAIDRLKLQKSSGMHVEAFGDALASVEESLCFLFEGLRPKRDTDEPEEYESSKAEFIKRCRGYLPKAPTSRKNRIG